MVLLSPGHLNWEWVSRSSGFPEKGNSIIKTYLKNKTCRHSTSLFIHHSFRLRLPVPLPSRDLRLYPCRAPPAGSPKASSLGCSRLAGFPQNHPGDISGCGNIHFPDVWPGWWCHPEIGEPFASLSNGPNLQRGRLRSLTVLTLMFPLSVSLSLKFMLRMFLLSCPYRQIMV